MFGAGPLATESDPSAVAHTVSGNSSDATVARASLSALVTILAIDGAIPAWFKRHCGLLAAIGTRDGSSLSSVCLVPARSALLILL